MFSSGTLTRDDFKIPGQYTKTDSDYYPVQQSGLARYRSAPSSLFATLLNSDTDNSSSGDDESEAILSAFLNGPPFDLNQKNDGFCMKQESQVETRPGFGQMGYDGVVSMGGGAVVGSYGSGTGSGLVRQSSSPAGFLHGYSINGEAGNYKVQAHQEPSSSASGLNSHMSFSSAPSSNLSYMPTIPEARNEGVYTHSPEIRNGTSGNGREFETSTFHHNSLNESSSFGGVKRNREGEFKTFPGFNSLENQNGGNGKSSSGLVHHMSLPKTANEMANVEKFLQFQQDVVPCQIRAKRGFATHPRSIAERVRRTKISERMNKLQDLFPNMDKQINKAEMLDLAIEYIKDLQKQVETLTETKSKCICPSKQEQQ